MRTERDSMGEMQVPEEALYGASTQRAVLNFPISKRRFSRSFIAALGTIKLAAARANQALGVVPADKAKAIAAACEEVIAGTLDTHFVVDIFQTGSGTSTNMNANEVIANRAIEMLKGKRGDRSLIHPNDHVNQCQSSNDVIPTAMNVAAWQSVSKVLIPSLTKLHNELVKKSSEFQGVIKSGRTHLQDATPVTLGQEFSGYAAQIEGAIERMRRSESSCTELALGGTAVGTGLNTHPEFARRAISEINAITGLNFREAKNHFEAQSARDSIVELSGQLKTIACSVMKIANDLRWLSSGPRCSIFEITLPEVQPGSSIMPAKVNPVIPESVMMVCAQVIGNDTTVTVCGQHGNFELNVMMPVMADNVLESIEILGSATKNLAEQCVSGVTANVEACLEFAEKSLATCTSLAPKIGYDQAAKVAKIAYSKNQTVRQAARELGVLPEAELDRVLDLLTMTKPGL
jgi:fumarate hydratase class II